MNSYQNEYQEKLCTAEQAVKLVHSGDSVFIGFVSSIAYTLTNALWDRRSELEQVKVCSSIALKSSPMFDDPSSNPFCVETIFPGPGERKVARAGRQYSFSSFHLSQVDIWCHEIAKPSICFFEVSEPDEDGFMSYGPTGGCVNHFARATADRIIVQVNPNTPYVQGKHCMIHISEVDAIIESNDELPELPEELVDSCTAKISQHILALVPDGATIQLGIGKLSTAVGYGLKDRNDLGVHSELFSTPIMRLMESGNVTNTKKGYMDGKSVFAFAMGSQAMYRFMHHNPHLYCGTFPYVNDPRVIAQNNNMISINSAMAVDIFGQVASEAMAWRQHSAVGGQVDFVRGAQWSPGGKSVIATSSSFIKHGVRQSKIVSSFPAGSIVTTSRADVQYIATEYGCINLKHLALRDRVRAMISLAHPDFRAQLTDEAKSHGLL